MVQLIQPDEIYNLGAQSHVAVSFESPEYTANSEVIGTANARGYTYLRLSRKNQILLVSTSELFGKVVETPQNEETPFTQEVLMLSLNYMLIG